MCNSLLDLLQKTIFHTRLYISRPYAHVFFLKLFGTLLFENKKRPVYAGVCKTNVHCMSFFAVCGSLSRLLDKRGENTKKQIQTARSIDHLFSYVSEKKRSFSCIIHVIILVWPVGENKWTLGNLRRKRRIISKKLGTNNSLSFYSCIPGTWNR
jgi:hypothetical protein